MKTNSYAASLIATIFGWTPIASAIADSHQPPLVSGQAATLSGRFYSRTMYGGPNFGLTPDRDKQFTAYFLTLNKATPFHDNVTGEDYSRPDETLDCVQLYLDESETSALKKHVGENIIVDGIIMAARTGYNITSYGIDVQHIKFQK